MDTPRELTAERLVHFVETEALTWRATPGAPRMRDVSAHGDPMLPSGSLEAAVELHQEGTPAPSVVDIVIDGALDTGCRWYAAGAGHAAWRRWFGLAALGHLLDDRLDDLCWSAVLGGESTLLRHLPPGPPRSRQPTQVALWNLLGGRPAAQIDPARDPCDEACQRLQRSIPGRDHPTTADALGTLADYWIAETDDWDRYLPGYDIQFEVVEAALAALAVEAGFDPRRLTTDQRHLLGPGLATEAPEPLFGRVFTR